MTPEIHKKYKNLQIIIDMIGPILAAIQPDELEKFEREAAPYADGTMSIIAAQFMGVQDLRTSEDNLKNAIEISRAFRHLRRLVLIEPKKELTT